MSKIRIHSHRSYSIVIDHEPDDIEVEVQYEPFDGYKECIFHHIEGDKMVVGYLSHDDSPMHPLDDCDGMGKIIGRGKYETGNHDESEMFEALGLNRDGDPNYEHDFVISVVEEKWREFLDGVSDDTWGEVLKELGYDGTGPYDQREMTNKLRDELAEVNIVDQWEVKWALMHARNYITEINPDSAQCTHAAINLNFNVEEQCHKAWQLGIETGVIGDRDAVMLDVYDHSGISWSVSGGGMQCRWDTTRGAGVWVPDDCLRSELSAPNPTWAHYVVRETPYSLKGTDKKYQLVQVVDTGDGFEHVEFSDDSLTLHNKAALLAADQPAPSPQRLARCRREQAERYAEQAVETYNDYISGDVYGVCVETFERQDDDSWEQVEEDACWGFIGFDYAVESLKTDYFQPVVKSLTATEAA